MLETNINNLSSLLEKMSVIESPCSRLDKICNKQGNGKVPAVPNIQRPQSTVNFLNKTQ